MPKYVVHATAMYSMYFVCNTHPPTVFMMYSALVSDVAIIKVGTKGTTLFVFWKKIKIKKKNGKIAGLIEVFLTKKRKQSKTFFQFKIKSVKIFLTKLMTDKEELGGKPTVYHIDPTLFFATTKSKAQL